MNQTKRKSGSVVTDKPVPPEPQTYSRLNHFFERYQNAFFYLSMLLGGVMSVLMFDAKVSLSGDDCDYILYANDFWHHFRFPGFRGPLYPIVMSPFIGLFGMNLIVLKSLSAVFILLSMWLTYKSFKDIVPAVILMPALLLSSLCSYIFFYAGYTYSEPLFMLTQALFIYFFSKFFLRNDASASYSLKRDWKKYLILGAFALSMGLTRSIGYAAVGVVVLYFIVKGQWKNMVYTIVAVIGVFLAFQLFKTIVWPDAGSAYDIRNYLAKDYYNLNAGMEDMPGYWHRIVRNSQIYLSNFLCQMLGVIHELPSNFLDVDVTRTVILYVLFFASFILVARRNAPLLFASLYVGVLNFASFVVLQVIWAQDRLIMIYYPLILIVLFGGLFYAFSLPKLRRFFFVYPVVLLLLLGGTLKTTSGRVGRTLPVLQQNVLLGDPLYGLTPDWQNFIKASQWIATNTDKNAVIVSRKPSMSKVYTGRDFAGLPASMVVPADTLNYLKADTSIVPVIADGRKNIIQGEMLRYVISAKEPFELNGQQTIMACVYAFPRGEADRILQELSQAGVAYTLDLDPIIELARTPTLRIQDPDMMLRFLHEYHIEYLLLAQLRIDPTQNTGEYINNIHRYAWTISMKYPGAFETVKTFGTSEPCEIIKLRR